MRLTVEDAGMGMVRAYNDEITLLGGFRSGSSSAGTTRCRFIVYDHQKESEMLRKGIPESEVSEACQVGLTDLFIKDGSGFDIQGLVNIEIKKRDRKQGYARKVINSITSTIEKDLKIHDIKKSYVSTWRKLGVTQFTDLAGREVTPSKHKVGELNGVIPAIVPEMAKEQKGRLQAAMG